MHYSLNSALINKIKRCGKIYRTEFLSVKYVPSKQYRYSPIISKKKGNAVKRNRVKRIIRDIMTSSKSSYPGGLFLIYFNGHCDTADHETIRKELDEIIINKIAREL